jgi:simple sugar transport system permease protein
MDKTLLLGLIATALAFAAPLLLAALGELIGERSGVLNIGLEGMMLSGALAGAAVSFASRNAGVGLLGAMLAGTALAAIFALLAITLRADAVVVGTGLNLFALGITGLAHRALSASWGSYQAVGLPPGFFMATGALLVPLLWWGFASTRIGLQVRAVGEYPVAADTAGVRVRRLRWICTLCNGALCGMAGAFLSMSHTNSFGENMTAGRGFIALALVIFGRWNPWGALAGALLFGAAEGSQFFLQTRIGSLFYPLLLALPYVLTILVLSGFAGKTRAPAALAQPYEK